MIAVLNLFDLVPGREKEYGEYLQQVQPLLERFQGKVLFYGSARKIYAGNCHQQYCGLVVYPGMTELRQFSLSPEFKRIRAMRDRSTLNYVLTIYEEISLEAFAQMLTNNETGIETPDR